ncbi:MAG: 16S rRNA (guanine(966)-N(2))-methyltransferase RsmD [Oceanicoccus sp.]
MKPANSKEKKNRSNQLRIIGGKWRGRKLAFPSIEGLRPTPDRVRETLFNWLAADIPAARCLDLFAGSGALGLEALSRGALHVDFVDRSPEPVKQLINNLQLLDAANGRVQQDDAVNWLQQLQQSPITTAYDIIFLDAPFRQNLVGDCLNLLTTCLSANGKIYLEMGREEILPATPDDWRLHREKFAGQICYRLFTRDKQNLPTQV